MRHRSRLGNLGRAVVLILGFASLTLPLVAFFGLDEPLGGPFDHPTRVAYYRLTVLALVVGAMSGLIATVLGGWSWGLLRGIGMGLGGLGLFVNASLLLVLVGLCGPAVLWGYCGP